MKYLRIFIVNLILLMLIIVPVASINAAESLKEYLSSGGDGNSEKICAGAAYSMQFTTDATAHSITRIKVMLKKVGSPGDIEISLRAASGGAPSSTVDLVKLTYDADTLSTEYGWCEVELTSPYYTVSASTQYSIVIKNPSGDSSSNYVYWQIDSGGGLANAVASKSTDGGSTWASETPKDCLFEIYGDTVLDIISAKVFRSYLSSGDMLICAEVLNNCPPYAPSGMDYLYDVKKYFALRLYGLDNTTILASTPLTSWDDAPESLYISASLANTLTEGGAYYVKVIGTYSGAPSDSYTLTSADWKGDDLTHLDSWVRLTANKLEIYYSGESFIRWSTELNSEILTDSGGGIFTNAIPGLAQERPDLFDHASSKAQLDKGTANNQYDTATDYTSQLGSEVAGLLDSGGNVFGVSGQTFGASLIAISIAIVILCGALMSQVGAIPILIVAGLPLLYIGNYTRLIGIQWTVVLGILMVILFVRQMWWKTT